MHLLSELLQFDYQGMSYIRTGDITAGLVKPGYCRVPVQFSLRHVAAEGNPQTGTPLLGAGAAYRLDNWVKTKLTFAIA